MSRLLGFYDIHGNPIPFHDIATKIQFIDTDLNCQNVAEAIVALKAAIAAIEGGGSIDPADIPDITELINKVDLLQATINSALSDEGLSSPIGIGTFQEAYDAYKGLAESETLFTWILDDVDDDNRPVKKVIYHVGNGAFIDAIGASIVGDLEGLTIVTKGSAKVKIGSSSDNNEITLQDGINNFTVNGRHLVGGNASDSINYLDEDGNISYMEFTGSPGNIIDVDFGGIGYRVNNPRGGATGCFRSSLSSLRSVRRMKAVGSLNQCFSGNTSVQYIQIYSDEIIDQRENANQGSEVFRGTTNLRYLDIKNLQIIPEKLNNYFYGCGATTYDIRGFELPSADYNPQLSATFSYSSVCSIIIGEDFNVNNGVSGPTEFTPGGLEIICVSETPPVCTKRWMPDKCTIKVPPGCTEAYRTAWSSILTSEMEIVEYRENEY